MSDFEVVHLNAVKCSRRAVRFVPLDPAEHETVQLLATKDIDPTQSMLDLRRLEWKYGLHQMIKQVTVEPVTDPYAADVKWKKVTPAILDETFKELFTAKDNQVLTALYRQYHDVTEEELKMISGKVQTVSEG